MALPLSSVTITFDRDMRRERRDAPDSVLNPDNYVLVNSRGRGSRSPRSATTPHADRDAALRVARRRPLHAHRRPADPLGGGLELAAPYTMTFDAVQDFSPLVDVLFLATRSDRATGTVSFDVRRRTGPPTTCASRCCSCSTRRGISRAPRSARAAARTASGCSISAPGCRTASSRRMPRRTCTTVTLTNPQAST